jgi:hypothetical protein
MIFNVLYILVLNSIFNKLMIVCIFLFDVLRPIQFEQKKQCNHRQFTLYNIMNKCFRE